MKGIRVAAAAVCLAALSWFPLAQAQTPSPPPGAVPATLPAAVQPAPSSDIDLQIIGFGVDEATKAQLEEAAAAGGGKYYPAENQQDLTAALGKATGLGTGGPATGGQEAVMLVLDVSNSMWGQIEGKSKIDIARGAIHTLLGSWKQSADLGLMAYGHNRASDCSDIQTLRKVTPLDAGEFDALVGHLTPRGKTPLTEAVRQAADELGIKTRPASVILFSDGIDTCGGDPCVLAGELKAMGVNFTAHVIGFSVAADEKQLACLAETTGGLYLSADNAPQLQKALQTVADRAAAPAATDLTTLEALDPSTGQPVTSGVVWTVSSLASEDPVPLTAGVSRPELPLAPGQYVAEAKAGMATGHAPFEVAANQAQLVQVRLDSGMIATPSTAACAEPNNDFASPSPADIASGVRGSIYPKGNVDFCAIDVAAPGVLTIAATAAPAGVELIARVDDIDRKAVRDWTSSLLPGVAPVEADLPESGRYVLEVSDAYSDAASSDPYALALAFTPVVDATEPNDSLTRPGRIAFGTPTDVAIFPRGEHDFLAVEAEEQGELTITASEVPKDIDSAMRLFGSEYGVVKDWQSAPAGQDNTIVVDLPAPGRYILELADSYDDARSPLPMKVNAAFVASPDPYEPDNTITAAADLAFGTPVQITILPRADQDYFLLDAPHRGRVSISATGVPGIEMGARLFDHDRALAKDWTISPAAGADLGFDVDLPGPGKYWLQVADAYDDGRSVQPSTLTATLAPAEDAMEPNDRARDAKPLALGSPIEASILPRGDHDLYALDLAATPLTVKASNMPKGMDVALRLLDGNLAMVGNWVSAQALGADAELKIDVPAPGRYLIEVADSYDDASDPASFTLTATQP